MGSLAGLLSLYVQDSETVGKLPLSQGSIGMFLGEIELEYPVRYLFLSHHHTVHADLFNATFGFGGCPDLNPSVPGGKDLQTLTLMCLNLTTRQ